MFGRYSCEQLITWTGIFKPSLCNASEIHRMRNQHFSRIASKRIRWKLEDLGRTTTGSLRLIRAPSKQRDPAKRRKLCGIECVARGETLGENRLEKREALFNVAQGWRLHATRIVTSTRVARLPLETPWPGIKNGVSARNAVCHIRCVIYEKSDSQCSFLSQANIIAPLCRCCNWHKRMQLRYIKINIFTWISNIHVNLFFIF